MLQLLALASFQLHATAFSQALPVMGRINIILNTIVIICSLEAHLQLQQNSFHQANMDCLITSNFYSSNKNIKVWRSRDCHFLEHIM
jgi:hypothetical protein